MKHMKTKIISFLSVTSLLILVLATLPAGAQNPEPAERVVVRYDDGNFQVLSRTPIVKALAASDILPAELGAVSGFWYELQAPDGTVIYRRIIANPLRVTHEGSDVEGASPSLIEHFPASKVFSVIIPRAGDGDQLVLFCSPLEPAVVRAFPAAEVARLVFGGAVAAFAPAPPPQPGPGDGTVVGATKVVDNGPDAQRFNLVLLAEGYREAELPLFRQHVQDFIDQFFDTSPFRENCSAFNIWRIEVTSTDSGADDPAPPADNPGTPENEALRCAGGAGTTVATYFDATFCADGVIRRLTGANGGTAIAVLNAQVPQWDNALIIVNSAIRGGSGGNPGVTTVGGGDWKDVAIHEIGHSAFGLADEYDYWAGCGVDAAGTRDNHPAGEPSEPNVTLQTDRTMIKWRDLIDAATPVPTTQNADCTRCDNQANPFTGQVVGLYEGAHYYHCDAYRPTFFCKMRVTTDPFCQVCTREILADLAAFQPPNTAPTCNAGVSVALECAGATTSHQFDGRLSIDVDCDPLTFQWTGPFIGGAVSGPTPTVQFVGTGVFTVTLTVSDGTASGSCTKTVTVRDTLAPAINCPANIVKANDPGLCSAVVLFQATATDVCAGPLTAACVPPSGSVFPKGVTTVVCGVSDPAGNRSECAFSVTVEDREPPRASCLPGTNPSGQRIPGERLGLDHSDGFLALSAQDNCDPNPAIYLRDSASGFTAGPFANGDRIKLTQALGTRPRQANAPGVLRAHLLFNGDALLYAVDADGNTSTPVICSVPPKHK